MSIEITSSEIKGLLTNEGVDKSRLAEASGWKIYPTRFAVTEDKGDFSTYRDIDSCFPQWFAQPIGGALERDINTIEFLCSIPAGSTAESELIREIYLFAEDNNGVEFLLALYTVTEGDAIIYDPKKGSLQFRLQISILNVSNAIFVFRYTQANEIHEHQNDINAHQGLLAPYMHASTYSTFGKGTEVAYGHLRVTDTLDSSKTAEYGLTASLALVSEIYTIAGEARETATTASNTVNNKQNRLIPGANIKIEGDTISSNIASNYSELSNLPSINDVMLSGNKTSAQLGLAPATDLNNIAASLLTKADASTVYTKQEVDEKLTNIYKYQGTVADLDALFAIENPVAGDVYNLLDNGDNYAWTGTEWDRLSGIVSGFATTTQFEEHTNNVSNPHNVTMEQIAVDATNEVRGVVTLLDAIDDTSNQNSGVSATPLAVKTVNDRVNEIQTSLDSKVSMTGDNNIEGSLAVTQSVSCNSLVLNGWTLTVI